MYILNAPSMDEVNQLSLLFNQHMEPLIQKLEKAYLAGKLPADFMEIPQYIQVCRWPFRKLEYSFVIDALLNRLQPGSSYLDAGSGVTPFAHVFAEHGINAKACDGNPILIESLKQIHPEAIYGSYVDYSTQDLTATHFPDNTFDAVSCVSVLEHIPAPYDQVALRELFRILKPGGLLAVTVDFTPGNGTVNKSRLGYYTQRIARLIQQGNVKEIFAGYNRKRQSEKKSREVPGLIPRSANQCFETSHINNNLLPAIEGVEQGSRLPFGNNLEDCTQVDARHFWNLQPGLYELQGSRDVLPAAFIIKKPV
jgi:ubiquinone/menaquinone biosynthesis C-methylase UbiE